MLEKLAGIEKKYQDLTKKLGDPDLLGDPQHYGQVAKQHAELEEIVSKYQEYLRVEKELQDSEQMLADDPDPDMRELISEEIDSLQEAREKLRGDLRLLL